MEYVGELGDSISRDRPFPLAAGGHKRADSQGGVHPGSFPRILGLPVHAYLVYKSRLLHAYLVYICA
jgi:hypothetical protein